MGFRDRHAEKKAAKALQAEREAAELALRAWSDEEQELTELLHEARDQVGVRDGVGLMLKKNEEVFLVLDGSALIEPRKLPGHWEGRSPGDSFRVAKGLTYRLGSSRGHYVQGEEVPSPVDTGILTITNQRVVFQGAKATREWAFAKLLGLQHVDSPKSPWTALQVSNRQKTSGFLYTPSTLRLVRFRLELALAHFNGEVDELVRGLEERLAEHLARRPAELSATPATPALPTSGSDGIEGTP